MRADTTDSKRDSRPRSRGLAHASSVDRALERLYERRGAGILWVAVGVAAALGLITAAVTVTVVMRFLEASTGQVVSVLKVFLPLTVVLGLLGLLPSVAQWRSMRAWSGSGRSQERAAETWLALVRHPLLTLRASVVLAVATPPLAVWLVGYLDRPWWGVFPVAMAGLAGIASATVLIPSVTDFLARPMRADVAAHLPEDFEPVAAGLTLRARTVLPVAVVALFAALLVGAYANLSDNGLVRMTLVLAAALVTVVLATAVLLVINRSALRPLEELASATRRVRDGEVVTPVHVVSADELGLLAHDFNLMLAGLRERDHLRDEVLKREAELRASRARIVAASDAERRRVERNIHDGAQQQLVGLAVKLRMLEERLGADEQLRAAVAEIETRLKGALQDLRELARGLHPSVLTTDGLPPALEQLAARAPLPVAVSAPEERFPEALESTAYFVACEALANVAKYAQATQAEISIQRRSDHLIVQIADDGIGGAHAYPGSGLTGLVDRVAALDGTLTVHSPRGQGTKVIADLPIDEPASGAPHAT